MNRPNHTQPQRLTEIEGLRGVLAWWVVLGHFLSYAGFTAALPGLMRIVRVGRYGVDVFIVISGFVIWYLLDTRSEDWRKFIIRRFFRLYPVFIVTFFCAILLNDLRSDNLALCKGLYSPEQWKWFFVTYSADGANTWRHVVAHSTMFHGMIPNRLLNNSALAFLGPAWSISVEWQFYLMAPLLIWFVRRKWIYAVLLSLVVALTLWTRGKIPDAELGGGFLPFHVEFFYLGILSYYAFKHLMRFENAARRLCKHVVWLAFLLILIFVPNVQNIFFDTDRLKPGNWIPVTIWAIFFAVLLDMRTGVKSSLARVLARFLNSKVVQFLGKISYSTYLGHFLVIVLCQWFIFKIFPGVGRVGMFWLLFVLGVPLVVGLSVLLHRFLEEPGIRLGKRLAGSQ